MVQTAVNQYQTLGVPGEFADDSPKRVAPYAVLANNGAQPTCGYAFTQGTNDNEAIVGGTGTYLQQIVLSIFYPQYWLYISNAGTDDMY